MIKNLQAIVLAAGKSTRFNTGRTKLTQKICGQEMVLYPTMLLEHLKVPTTIVVGYQKEVVQAIVTKKHGSKISFIVQEEQLGTGHAILCTKAHWTEENILIMNGDMPLVSKDIIEKLYKKHEETNAAVSFVIAHNIEPTVTSYGRVITNNGTIQIIEAKDFEGDTHEHCCINAGIYIVKKEFLQKGINELQTNNKSNEFYFTDLIKIASEKKQIVATCITAFDRIRGVNNLQELWAAEQIKRSDLIKYWMDNGVRFTTPQNVHIDLDVTIGAGTIIGCGSQITNGTTIGKYCRIDHFNELDNATLDDCVTVRSHCIIRNAHIKKEALVGPFAHVCDNTTIEQESIIGNFVEVKRSVVGKQSRAKHLSYIGDAQIGSNVNIGAGTITCNYDGSQKHPTIIKNNVFIGSNNTLVAPVTVEKNSYTAAGSVITDDVPQETLALGRSRQINKEGYAHKLRTCAQNNDQVTPTTACFKPHKRTISTKQS